MAAPDLFAQLQVVRRRVVEALVDRRFPDGDAQDVAREVLAEIMADLAGFAELLAAVEDYAEHFEKLALITYLGHLSEERRRRPDSGVL